MNEYLRYRILENPYLLHIIFIDLIPSLFNVISVKSIYLITTSISSLLKEYEIVVLLSLFIKKSY